MKALMVAIQPKYLKMILDGEKPFEYRNWNSSPKKMRELIGKEIYFYCTKAKPYLWDIVQQSGIDFYGSRYLIRDINLPMNELIYTGHQLNGKVVAKAVVKDVYSDITCGLGSRSTSNKHYLLQTIKKNDDLIPYSYIDCTKPIIEKEKAIQCGWDWQRYAIELSQVEAIEPKDVTEFVSCRLSNIAMCDVPLTKPPQSRTWIYVKE